MKRVDPCPSRTVEIPAKHTYTVCCTYRTNVHVFLMLSVNLEALGGYRRVLLNSILNKYHKTCRCELD
jgi:hypothetical protein